MAKAWDIEPSIFAGMIEEDVGLKIRYIAMQILTAIDIAAPVDTGRFRNNNLVLLQHPDFGISDNVDPNGTIAVQRGIGVISKAANYGVIYIQNNLPYAEALENGHSQQAPTGVYANAFHGVLQAYK
ncbi:HK97 gp10 family phage protein [Escherichia coli]|uniref:HK97 gp10 family phage protein n=1 Tax=Escherichia coli TaxID=562 RepID=UPI002DBB7128|nr:HK97 gp10 family phage protein [Escherichia coli]MEC3733830.1 HK97 gp10 family phage protein [Escherichia coli]